MFAVALVTLAGLGIVFRISAGIGRQRPRDVVSLLELALLATDIAFVGQRTAANANRGVGRQKAAKPAAKAKQAQAPARASQLIGGRHGPASLLERLSQTLARHLSGADDAGDLRKREDPLSYPQSPDPNRVVSHYVDSVTGKEVKEEDEVKGYQRGEHEYVILEDEELENVALESTKTIDISTFTPRDSIEWIWLDTPYYLSPNDPVGQGAFSVIRDAMEAQNMVGISRLVISRRERAVMLEPRGKGIVLWTLRYGDEVRDEDSYFEAIGDEQADSEMMPLVQQLIKKQTKDWTPKMVADPVQERLLEIIAAKRRR